MIKRIIKKVGGLKRGQGRNPGIGKGGGQAGGSGGAGAFPEAREHFQTFINEIKEKLRPIAIDDTNITDYLPKNYSIRL
ncbi:unnamed protein product [Arabis nemorensis]|uniref:Uncharacterized protein n=1 Tax=Arabis nemorensis TaxID=586526 RepID=A0A565AXY9_9BRAS|nr:unnamed protein product [Arabis nemorensis]